MKKSKLMYLFTAIVLSFLILDCSDDGPNGEEQIEDATKVKITTPGTLKDVLGLDYLGMTKLIIEGSLNGDDLHTIANMSNLTHLDMRNVFIVAGGNFRGSSIPFDDIDAIPSFMFRRHANLNTILLPKTVLRINEDAFAQCPKLQTVKLPEYLNTISEYAFDGCTGLTSIDIPNNTKSIYPYAFARCNNLKTIILPKNLISLGKGAFLECKALTIINLPDNLGSIEAWAFADCTGLTSISLPNSLEYLGEGVFVRCNGLKEVILPQNLNSVPRYTFSECTSLSSIRIPDKVEFIRDNAFNNCAALTAVNFPVSVKSIEDNAFINCTGLSTISLPNVVYLNKSFIGCTGLKTVYIGTDISFINEKAFEGSNNIKEYHIKSVAPPVYGYFHDFSESGIYDLNVRSSVSLFVPKGSKARYQENEKWQGFKEYIEE